MGYDSYTVEYPIISQAKWSETYSHIGTLMYSECVFAYYFKLNTFSDLFLFLFLFSFLSIYFITIIIIFYIVLIDLPIQSLSILNS